MFIGLNCIQETKNTLKFIIISKNEEKIEQTVLDIFDVFFIEEKESTKAIEDLKKQKNDIGFSRDINVYIDKNYHIEITVLSGIKSAKGQRAPFLIIDKDIKIEEYDIYDIILPITQNHQSTKLFTNGKRIFVNIMKGEKL